jgi:SAM-dependent methyltransferase
MDLRYPDVINRLRAAYDRDAERRDRAGKDPWKVAERAAFLRRLRDEGHGRLLEIGAGPGQDGRYFADQGLDVVATDLSAEMVARCRSKGLEAHVRDFLRLGPPDGFPAASFDAVWALNCLLHVPNTDLPAVLAAVRTVLRPGGLFFLGVYGAAETSEGVEAGDAYDPPRFFSWRTDEYLLRVVADTFAVVDFHVLDLGKYPFQSLTLRRPAG